MDGAYFILSFGGWILAFLSYDIIQKNTNLKWLSPV